MSAAWPESRTAACGSPPAGQREGYKKKKRKKDVDKKDKKEGQSRYGGLKLRQRFIGWRSLGRVFVGGSGERYVFKCVSAGLRTRFTGCEKNAATSSLPVTSSSGFFALLFISSGSQTTTTRNDDYQPF